MTSTTVAETCCETHLPGLWRDIMRQAEDPWRTSDDGVDPRGQVFQFRGGAQVDAPGADFLAHTLEGVLADRGEEPGEHAGPVPCRGVPGAERVTQEGERRLRAVRAPPLPVLAVSGSPGESRPRAPTGRSVTVSRHSALTIQSGGNGVSKPSARTDRDRVASP